MFNKAQVRTKFKPYALMAYTSVVLLMSSCAATFVPGEYAQCSWSCIQLQLNENGTYTETLQPPSGSIVTVKGTWKKVSDKIVTQPDPVNGLRYDNETGKYFYYEISRKSNEEPDTIKHVVNTYPGEQLTQQYLIKKDMLLPLFSQNERTFKTDECAFIYKNAPSERLTKLLRDNLKKCEIKNRINSIK